MRYQFLGKMCCTWSKRWLLINCQQYRWSPSMVQLYVEWCIGFVVEILDSNRHPRHHRRHFVSSHQVCEYNSLKRLRSGHFEPYSIHQPPANRKKNEKKDTNRAKFVNWTFFLSTTLARREKKTNKWPKSRWQQPKLWWD